MISSLRPNNAVNQVALPMSAFVLLAVTCSQYKYGNLVRSGGRILKVWGYGRSICMRWRSNRVVIHIYYKEGGVVRCK